jgi:hypothetical protein
MQNDCIFSVDRRYRFVLKHTWEPLFPPKLCTWIGLNPSIADETQLDATLRRIRAFSAAWGYNGFIKTNLFGLVSTDPDQLYTIHDRRTIVTSSRLLKKLNRLSQHGVSLVAIKTGAPRF